MLLLIFKDGCYRCMIIESLRSNGCGWFFFPRRGFTFWRRRLVYLRSDSKKMLLTTVIIVAPAPVSSRGRRFEFRSRLSSRWSLVTSHLLLPHVLLLFSSETDAWFRFARVGHRSFFGLLCLGQQFGPYLVFSCWCPTCWAPLSMFLAFLLAVVVNYVFVQ